MCNKPAQTRLVSTTRIWARRLNATAAHGFEFDDVHMGMRVKAKWADELKPDHTSILWWEPTGEPDEDYARYKDYL